ncbi:hypothetical protein DPMN_049996 [Dreissena polymorpha]|uniref:Uncharacterized protein n=1 Tax=Dreissena polymorpha TaxID=45954 RepID=A0A9D4CFA9_DREPO|nr:hypothetical protein DPMN_049996 [Dreissena polymorpha]
MNFWNSMKTRTGANAADAKINSSEDVCLTRFSIFNQYSDKRLPGFSTDDSPFYLATRTVPLIDSSDQWFLRQKLGEKNCQDVENYGNRSRF